MCFSSNVSFIAAGVLAGIGIATLKSTHKKRLKPLALIPFLFAIQQAAEGIIWLTHNPPPTFLFIGALYLFFGTALVFWPTWIPFALFYGEHDQTRKKILFWFFCFGILFSAYTLFLLFMYPLTVEVVGHSLAYVLNTPNTYEYLRIIAYVIPTVIPLFISSIRYAWLLGILLTVSLGISYTIFYATSGSVWCFFAALLSILLWYSINQEQKQ